MLNNEEKQRLVDNIAGHLIKAQKLIQDRAVLNFSQVDPELGRRVKEALAKLALPVCSGNPLLLRLQM